VIGDPYQAGAVGLDEVDGSAQLNTAIKVDRTGDRSRIGRPLRGSGCQAGGELEMPRDKAGIVKAGPPQPFAQIGADCGNAIKSDTLDGGSKVVVVPRGDIGNDSIELLLNPIEVAGPYRKQSFSLQAGEKLELDVMD
jgi:hypothetical protein